MSNTIDQEIAALERRKAALLVRKTCLHHLDCASEREKDEGLLRVIGAAMERRLTEGREAGKVGWHAERSTEELRAKHAEAAGAGRWLDAGIYASMLYVRMAIATSDS